MGSFFRLADAVNFMTPQELIMILAVVIPLSLSVFFFVFFFCLDSSFNGSAQDCHTTSRL